jgi:putative transposase
MHDRLANGRNFRTMNVMDDFSRECFAVDVAFSFGTYDVIRCFEAIAFEHGLPETIRFDNGPEFTSRRMLQRGADQDVALHFIDPGKPTQNAMIESLNGRIRDELLNAHTFATIGDARRLAEEWRSTTTRSGRTPESKTLPRESSHKKH